MALKGGGDCILIPGAQDANGGVQPDKVCGTKNGLPTATADGTAAANSKTVCCKYTLQIFTANLQSLAVLHIPL